ncbi:rhodanese-like domain-containing protein [Nocardia sp. CNY236]|uniref:rhodanese-like domain-containing protein n=1 Tax=Nocardia sp. CNY236 TaxID=1169152 RepID=UPI000408AE1E|nr:rhodanese-like domain-containing protein [Nocardia sp. CNY236]
MSYAGDITPEQAWDLLHSHSDAVLVDVRTEAEWRFVGVPDTSSVGRPTVLVEWADSAGARNETFLEQLTHALGDHDPDAPVVFLCRSGQRSRGAAITATSAGYRTCYNVLDGFEGPLDEFGHRGGAGWRRLGLPWRQS